MLAPAAREDSQAAIELQQPPRHRPQAQFGNRRAGRRPRRRLLAEDAQFGESGAQRIDRQGIDDAAVFTVADPFLGAAAGVIASLPIVFFGNARPLRLTGEIARMYEDYGFEPVMPMLLPDTYYLWQVVVVLVILLFTVAFSVRKIFKMNVINALRA